jgi:tRNA-splicing ligase RtcB
MTYQYRAVDGAKVGVKTWGTIEEGALLQADDLARLPFTIRHVALMPDAHQGYGMPIGGVLFADAAVVPYAIGVDIGCGVILGQTDLTVSDFTPLAKKLGDQILRDVPVGNGPGGNLREPLDEDTALSLMGYAERPYMVDEAAWKNALGQLGSLGGGNHFIEFQADEDDRVYVMLHSGSRSLGKKTCDRFVEIALRLNDQWHSRIPNRELAFLPKGTKEHDDYWTAMEFALRFAEQNRIAMLDHVRDALNRHAGNGGVEVIVDCHHNYAAWENHGNQNGIVHRKGAVRARAGEDVLIPGSMGSASYWARGLGNPESFQSCQHGAGRAMARGVARRSISLEDMKADLAAASTTVYTHSLDAVRDEAPGAYKDVDSVMAASTDLVEIVKRLRPLGTVKG